MSVSRQREQEASKKQADKAVRDAMDRKLMRELEKEKEKELKNNKGATSKDLSYAINEANKKDNCNNNKKGGQVGKIKKQGSSGSLTDKKK